MVGGEADSPVVRIDATDDKPAKARSIGHVDITHDQRKGCLPECLEISRWQIHEMELKRRLLMDQCTILALSEFERRSQCFMARHKGGCGVPNAFQIQWTLDAMHRRHHEASVRELLCKDKTLLVRTQLYASRTAGAQ